jgi:hypothetical protein
VNIDEVVAQHLAELMAVPGIVGVGVAERAGKEVILVMRSHVTAESQALPAELDGFPIVVDTTGEITAF